MKEYFRMLDLEYSKPPRDVGTLLKATLKKTNNEVMHITRNGVLIAAVTLIKLSYNIFIIHELIVKKEYRNQGYLTELMSKVHNKFKGIFVLKATNAKGFYETIGYNYIGGNILAYVNDENLLRRKY